MVVRSSPTLRGAFYAAPFSIIFWGGIALIWSL